VNRGGFLVIVLPLVLSGCVAGWRRADLNVPQPLSPTQQVEVWRGNGAVRWHIVDVTRDSIIGIPLGQPVSCDSCRRAVARAQVDSVRWGYPVSGFFKTIVFGFLTLGTVIVVYDLPSAVTR